MLGVIDGKYQLLRELGHGGMGVVYEAVHLATGRRVAVKHILGDAASSADGIGRFQRETRAVGAIDSRHVVQVLDGGVDPPTGGPYMVMELLAGEDLLALIHRRGALSVDAALRVGAQACAGLHAAHERGITHRDVKSANLFLARVDQDEVMVKILDFGIAKLKTAMAADPGLSLTQTGTVIGSPLYLSPEQAMGAKNADARSDLWSLGVVLYEAMSGRTPHADCDTIGSLLVAICTRAPRPLAEVAPWVPPPVAAIVHKALSIDLALRFQSGAEMRAAVTALLPGGAQLNARLLEQPAGSGAEAGLAGTLLAPLAAGVTPQASTGGAWMSGTPQRGGLPGRVRTSSSRAVRLSVLTSVGAAAILALVFGAFRLAARDRVGAREVPLPTSAPSVTVTVATEEHAAPLPSLDPSPPPLAQLTEVVPSITQRPRPAKRPDAGLQVSSPKKADPPAEPNASLNHGKDRCDDEDVSGCFALGVTYEAGFDGVTKSYPHALEAYRRGCARGNPACCTRVGEVLKEEAQP